jgi:hypothetical protein
LAGITWVCATCAQHFTRAYGANRHNNNLHDGKGTLVRLLDYMVGRTNGRFAANDPMLYRRKRGRYNNDNVFFGSRSENRTKDSAHSMNNVVVHQDNIVCKLPNQRAKPENSISHIKNKSDASENSSDYSNTTLPSLEKTDNDKHKKNNKLLSEYHHSPSNGLDKLLQMKLKLQELEVLLNKHYSPDKVREFFRIVSYMAMLGNYDSYIDEILRFLHNIDTGGSNYENSLDLISREPSQEKAHTQHIATNCYDQGKAKLAAIEQMLKLHCPPDFVRYVITGLSNQFDATGDLSILDEALENHRKNVEQYCKRYF